MMATTTHNPDVDEARRLLAERKAAAEEAELAAIVKARAAERAELERQVEQAEAEQAAQAAAVQAAREWADKARVWLAHVEDGRVDLILAARLAESAAAEWARGRAVDLHISEHIWQRMNQAGLPVPLPGTSAFLNDLTAAEAAAEPKGNS